MFLMFTISVITLTSILAYAATKSTRVRDIELVHQAFRALFQWIGAFAIFLIVNVTLGAVAIIMMRSSTYRSIAVYDLDDPLILIFSAVQGFIFQRWWAGN
jgi:hypothetical protein